MCNKESYQLANSATVISKTYNTSKYIQHSDFFDIAFLYNQLYVENMSRKIIEVKTNYLQHDPFISFRAFGNLPHCQE